MPRAGWFSAVITGLAGRIELPGVDTGPDSFSPFDTMCVHTYTYTQYMCTYIHAQCTQIHSAHTSMHACMHTYIHANEKNLAATEWSRSPAWQSQDACALSRH